MCVTLNTVCRGVLLPKRYCRILLPQKYATCNIKHLNSEFKMLSSLINTAFMLKINHSALPHLCVCGG